VHVANNTGIQNTIVTDHTHVSNVEVHITAQNVRKTETPQPNAPYALETTHPTTKGVKATTASSTTETHTDILKPYQP